MLQNHPRAAALGIFVVGVGVSGILNADFSETLGVREPQVAEETYV